MNKSLPTINPKSYDDQLFHNNIKMQSLLEQLFPTLFLPYDSIFRLLSYLEETQINAMILPQIIRAIYNISVGTGEGRVVIHIKGGITNIESRENNEPLNIAQEFEK